MRQALAALEGQRVHVKASRVKPLALAVQSPLIGEAMGEALVQLGLSLDV